MNNKFDELTKQMAQSVSRRAALKKFGVGLAGMALACFGLANKARAGKPSLWPKCKECMDRCMAAGYSKDTCRALQCAVYCGNIN